MVNLTSTSNIIRNNVVMQARFLVPRKHTEYSQLLPNCI